MGVPRLRLGARLTVLVPAPRGALKWTVMARRVGVVSRVYLIAGGTVRPTAGVSTRRRRRTVGGRRAGGDAPVPRRGARTVHRRHAPTAARRRRREDPPRRDAG